MKTPTNAQQIFLYAAPFPALVFFKIWASTARGPGSLLAVSCAMLAYSIFVILVAYRWDKPGYFDWAVAAYFVVVSCSLAIWSDSAGKFFAQYAVTGIYSCLFAAAFFPPLFDLEPFTYHYAKKYTPQDAWDNPIFIAINRIMTYAWAVLFAVCLVLSLYPSLITRAIIPIGLIVCVGVPFNLRFPDYYLKKLGLPSLAEQRRMAQETPAQQKESYSELRLPETAWEAVSKMPSVFNAEAAGDLSAVIGFDVWGAEAFQACIEIDKGVCTFAERPPDNVDLLIRTPAEIWLSISRRELDGQKAFMQQSFTAKGNLGILMRLNQIFSAPSAPSGGI